MATREEQLAAKEAKLAAELEAVRQARANLIAPENVAATVVDRLFHGDNVEIRQSVALNVLDVVGGNAPQAASILRTSVADLHNAKAGRTKRSSKE